MLRRLRTLAETLGLGVVFLAAIGSSALAHLDSAIVRRVTVARLNGVLGSVVAGRIVIDRLDYVGPTGVSGVDAHVVDPDGVTVVRVSGVSAALDTVTLLRSLSDGDDISVDIPATAVTRADVSLDGDERGLRIARAFGPARQSSPAPSSTPGRGVRLLLGHVQLDHVAVHGQPPGAPAVDADVDGSDAGVAVNPDRITLDLRHAHLVARNMPAPATTQGTLDAHFEQPTASGALPDIRVVWQGQVGDVALAARGVMDSGEVDAVVDVPPATPPALRTLWPACPFAEDATVHAEAHGDLQALTVLATASVGKGTVTVSGPVAVGDTLLADLHLVATGVDVHALAPSAPRSELGATADVTFSRAPGGAMGAVVALETPPGRLAGMPVPPTTVTGQMETDGTAPPRIEASLVVRDPAAPASAQVHLEPRGSSYRLSFDATVASANLSALPVVGAALGGSARATARGTFDLDTQHLDTDVDATVSSFRAGPMSLDAARLTAHASGPASAPAIDLDARGQSLAVGPLLFETLHAHMTGSPTHAPVHLSLHGHDADFVARADLDLHAGATLRDVAVSMDRRGESAKAEASLVAIGSGDVNVEGLSVDGLGSPLRASLRMSPGSLVVHATSRGLDLARLGRLTGQPSISGRATLDVDADIRRTSAEGHVAVDLSQGAFAGWKDATAHLDATLAGRKASGTLKASVGDVGSIALTTSSVEIGAGSAIDAQTWRGAWGGADVTGHVDLARLAAHLPAGALASSSGSVDLKGHVARDSASDATPDVELTAETHGLAIGEPSWRLDAIGARAHVTVDGRTGHTVLSAQLDDPAGGLVSVAATSDGVPYRAFFTSSSPLRDALLSMPFEATVTLPSRSVATLPAFLGTRGTQGNLEARGDWHGTLEHPTADVRATLAGGNPDPTLLSLPVDLTVVGHYDGARATATVSALHKGEPVLDASGSLDVRAADLFADAPPPWTASARAKLTGFPLQSIAALDNRQVRGNANGTVELDGLHQNGRAKVSLQLDDVEVGDVACQPSTLELTADDKAVDLSSRIAEPDGYAEARAHLGTKWGAALYPSPDAAVPAQFYFVAKNFRTAVLLPFVSGVFTELDGRIDANANVVIDPAARTIKPQGTITMRDGVLEVSALGNELHDAQATLTMTPDGVVTLEKASARGLTGRVQVAGSARFQGFDFTGAHVLLQVAKKEPIPLVADGIQAGLFDGKIDVTVQRSSSALGVDVQIPSMRLQLPLSAGHDVQSLGPLKDVRVGIARNGEFTPVPLGGDVEAAPAGGSGVPMRVAIHLGNAVEVKRGADLDVMLEGGPTIEVGKRVTAKGQIRLSHGTLNVQGKTFQIENGTITFVDDPTNPQVVLTASWNAPDGTTVYADFIGPLKTGKVTLRSEPALGKDEILALLLYGTTDQTGSASAGGAGAPQLGAATGVAGNAATDKLNRALTGVNQALDNLGLQGGISTKLDTSQTTPRPEVEVQIARDISLQVAWVLGVPPPGNNPDQYLLTIDWRFLRQWSLETTRGDAGTTILDLVWQHRY